MSRDFNSAEIRDAKERLAALLASGISYSDIIIALAFVAGDQANTLRSAAGVLNRGGGGFRDIAQAHTQDAEVLALVNQRLVSFERDLTRLVRGTKFSPSGSPGFVRHDVESSVIKTLLYDYGTNTLRVVFHKSGRFSDTWQYENVPDDLLRRFVSAASVGSFYGTYIKGKFTAAPVVSGVARPDLVPDGIVADDHLPYR